jgi:2-polyprenyl-6-methoxyphenol hydroxylase-like FAD-dependent oxidoreductase
MTGSRPLSVLIAGGGLSGLALAHGLLKDGHSVQVFERDADLSRKTGYMLHMNSYGGEALRRCLPDDLFDLYLATSRRTPERRESIVLTDQMHELSSQAHLGPPNDGERPHTGVHRKTLRQILLSRLGDSFHPGVAVVSYDESADGVTVTLADGSTASGDVLVGADGIRSAVRRQRLPQVRVMDAGIRGLGLYGRTILTPALLDAIPPLLLQGVIIAANRTGTRVLLGAFQQRETVADAAAAVAPDVQLDPVDDYIMVSCSVPPGTPVPPAAEWTDETPKLVRDAMLDAIDGWHPALRAIVGELELASIFGIPFGHIEPGAEWAPSRVTVIGDAAHAMLPTLGMGANLALNDARMLLDRLSGAARGETDLVSAIGGYEQDMRTLVYPFIEMTMEHDRNFGGGALTRLAEQEAAV